MVDDETTQPMNDESMILDIPMTQTEVLDLYLIVVNMMKRSGESKTALKQYIDGVYAGGV